MHILILWPTIGLTKFLTRLKNTFRETAHRDFSTREIWQPHEYFFRWQPRLKTLSFSEPTRMHTLQLYSSFDLNKSLTRLKNTFSWNCIATLFLSAKVDDYDMKTFFRRHPRCNIFLFQNLLGRIHWYFSPPFFWTSSWLDWKTLFVKLNADTFLCA